MACCAKVRKAPSARTGCRMRRSISMHHQACAALDDDGMPRRLKDRYLGEGFVGSSHGLACRLFNLQIVAQPA